MILSWEGSAPSEPRGAIDAALAYADETELVPPDKKAAASVLAWPLTEVTSRYPREERSRGWTLIAGPLESMVTRAREKGLRWLRGQKGSRELYRTLEEAA